MTNAAHYREQSSRAFNRYFDLDTADAKSQTILRAIYFRLVAIDLAQDEERATAPVGDVVPSVGDAVKKTPPRKRAARKPTTPKETTP